MRYVSIDVEACGLDTDTDSILEFGAVIDDLNDPLPLDELPVFHCYFIHEKLVGHPFALSMHPTILRRIAEREAPYSYLSPMKFGYRFRSWLMDNDFLAMHDRVTINAAGKNFGIFDYSILKKQTDLLKHVQLRHKILDPGILFLDSMDDSIPDLSTCKLRMGESGDVAHTAVDDAFDVVKMLRYKLVDSPEGPFHVRR